MIFLLPTAWGPRFFSSQRTQFLTRKRASFVLSVCAHRMRQVTHKSAARLPPLQANQQGCSDRHFPLLPPPPFVPVPTIMQAISAIESLISQFSPAHIAVLFLINQLIQLTLRGLSCLQYHNQCLHISGRNKMVRSTVKIKSHLSFCGVGACGCTAIAGSSLSWLDKMTSQLDKMT